MTRAPTCLRRYLRALAFCMLMLASSAPLHGQIALKGVWRGEAQISDGKMGIDTTIMSVDGNQFSGYMDLYSIGHGWAGVVSCSSFLGSINPETGQIALRTDPDIRVVNANGGDTSNIRTLVMVGTIAGQSWSGRFEWLSVFKTFQMRKVAMPILRKPHCKQTAVDLAARAQRRRALLAEKEALEKEKLQDNATFASIVDSAVAADCASSSVMTEDVAKELIYEGLKDQLLNLLPARYRVPLAAADWAYDFYVANRDGAPNLKRAKVAGDGFNCFAQGTTKRQTDLLSRRIRQEKRLTEIETELASLGADP